MGAKLKERREQYRPDPQAEMYGRLVLITPDMAERFLAKNTRNRTLSEARVKAGERDWKAGRTPKLSHQGVAFYASDDALADGQHRLTICARTGISFWCWVFWGMPDDAATDIDRHRPRSEADVIRIAGISDWIGRPELAIIKMMLQAHGQESSSYSVQALVEVGERVADEVLFTTMAFDGRKRRHLTASPVLAAVAIASAHEDQMRLLEFAEVLVTGMPQSEDDVAAVKLRDQLTGTDPRAARKLLHQGRAGRQAVLLRTMQAIKYFCERKHVKRLGDPKGDMPYQLEALQ